MLCNNSAPSTTRRKRSNIKTEEELEQIAEENGTTLMGLLTERPLIAHDNNTLANMIMAMEVGLENPDILWAEMGEFHKQIVLAVFQSVASREIQLRE